jgi:hypothetical protein
LILAVNRVLAEAVNGGNTRMRVVQPTGGSTKVEKKPKTAPVSQ